MNRKMQCVALYFLWSCSTFSVLLASDPDPRPGLDTYPDWDLEADNRFQRPPITTRRTSISVEDPLLLPLPPHSMIVYDDDYYDYDSIHDSSGHVHHEVVSYITIPEESESVTETQHATINVPGPPDVVRNCSTIKRLDGTSLKISCEAGDDGGLPQTFHLRVYNPDSVALIMNMISFDEPIFEVEHLDPDTLYVLTLYASNPKGNSTRVTLPVRTFFAAEPKTKSHDEHLKGNAPAAARPWCWSVVTAATLLSIFSEASLSRDLS